MAHTSPARGSEKLIAQLAKMGESATPEAVKAAVALPANNDYKLLRWLIRGIPPFYLEVETTFQVKPEQLGEAVGRFAAHTGIRDINILVNGIPIPDIAQIRVLVAEPGER